MKIFFILIIILMGNSTFAQSYDESLLSTIDVDYSRLYNELLEIVRDEFVSPICGDQLVFVYDKNYGYGTHVNPFTGEIYFSNASFLHCNTGTPVYSMTSGIVKNIILDRMVIIEYKGIEISYSDLDINNIKLGDFIDFGQLLGIRKCLDSLHNYFNGIIIKIKYKSFYFDIGHIINTIKNNSE